MRFSLLLFAFHITVIAGVSFAQAQQASGLLAAPSSNSVLGLKNADGAAAAQMTSSTTVAPAPSNMASGFTASGALSPSNPDFAIPGEQQQVKIDDDADPLKSPIYKALEPAEQQQVLNEAQNFYTNCTVKTDYAVMHNCECLSIHFTNERLRRPGDSVDKIGGDIEKDCVDEASTAGDAYNKCMNIYQTLYPEHLKLMCECYARLFAKDYAAHPFPQSDYIIHMGVQVAEQCHQDTGGSIPTPEPVISSIPEPPDLNSLRH